MALFAFEASGSSPMAISELLSPAQRMKTAGEVNAAILESLSQGKEVKLVSLLKLLCWGESLLEDHAEFPKASPFISVDNQLPTDISLVKVDLRDGLLYSDAQRDEKKEDRMQE